MEYRFTFSPTPADYAAARRYVQWRTLGCWRIPHLLISVLFGVILFTPIAFLVTFASRLAPTEARNYPLYAELALVGALALLLIYLKWLSRKMSRPSYTADGYLLEPRDTQVDANGIVFRSTRSVTTLLWNKMPAVHEDNTHLYFFTDPAVPFFIPKRALTDVEGLKAQLKIWKPDSLTPNRTCTK